MVSMARDRIIYDGKRVRTDVYTYKINSGGVGGDHISRERDTHYLNRGRGGYVTITFVDSKLESVNYDFTPEECSSYKFWVEIQAAVADQVIEIEDNYK